MDVDGSSLGDVEALREENMAVGSNHGELGGECAKGGKELLPARALRGKDRNPLRFGRFTHRSLPKLSSSTGRPIRLSDRGNHIVTLSEECTQCRYRKVRGPPEEDLHLTSLPGS
jgi:hypothetical protein